MPTIFCNAFKGKDGHTVEVHTFFPSLGADVAKAQPVATPEEIKGKFKAMFAGIG